MLSPRRLACLFALPALVATGWARETLVRAAPQSAVLFAAVGLPVNLDRLEINHVQATVKVENDLRTLVVESEIANPGGATMPAPPLRYLIRDAKGATLYTWTSSSGAKTIAAGARIPVRARLTAPPTGQDVVVNFMRGAG